MALKKSTLGLSLAAILLAGAAITGAAIAQGMDPLGTATVSRVQAQAKAEALFDKLDERHQGKLAVPDRAARQAAMFDHLDANHDGAISRDEFAAPRAGGGGDDEGKGDHHGAMLAHGHEGREGHHRAMMLQMADANHDGMVTKAEFVAGGLKMFDLADTNHDGQLTPTERKAAREKMHSLMRERWHNRGEGGDMPPPPPPPPGG